ncbi:MAG TPA: PAS domain-containing sensor histidine kinase, partial [Candidatus Kapabacteria bacterium]|nr:PAS domain-containing sensor histidine kinase [Candidatus Kapabacteria bacterium]
EYDNKFIVTSKSNSLIFEIRNNRFSFVKFYYYKYAKFIIPILVFLLFVFLLNKIKSKSKLLNIIANIPSTGFLFIINHKGKLIFANEYASKLLSLSSNIPLNKNFKDYFKDNSISEIYNFYEKNKSDKKTIKEKVSLLIDDSPTEWLFSIIPIRDFRGFAKGYVLSGIDITEQLERKRLANWAQLAHDMQTNLSTIKLNAEHISNSDIDQIHSRQKKIIHQVNILMNRIRDIVTVGRTDVLDLQQVSSYEICSQAVAEFDEELFPNVQFTLNIKNFELKCDKNKLVRAIRNAIENAIRALPDKKGDITISTDFDNDFAYFSVMDNGKGMDDETKSKFLKPYFTTSSQYGGSGIGTIIMQKVTELHKGRIIVESKVNEGTTITFAIPLKLSI